MLSRISYTYDAWGNLISETLNPTGLSYNQHTLTTAYEWDDELIGTNQNRLKRMTYPSGRTFEFNYGTQYGSHDLLSRAYGLRHVEDPGGNETLTDLITYAYTGGGRMVSKEWGPSGSRDVTLDLTGTTTVGLDRFGRTTRLDYFDGSETRIHDYQYGYDANGNRAFARITQAGAANTRSFLYDYDRLNRLVAAAHGVLTARSYPKTY